MDAIKKSKALLISLVVAVLTVFCPFVVGEEADHENANPSTRQISALWDDSPDLPSNSTKSLLQYYPESVGFGDFLYLSWFEINDSDKDQETLRCSTDFSERIVVSRKDEDGTYVYIHEEYGVLVSIGNYTLVQLAGGIDGVNIPFKELMKPGEKKQRYSSCLEFPPLEDWELPFWKKVREDLLVADSVVLHLKVHSYFRTFEFDITLKKRPQSELDILEAWRQKTSENGLLPESGLRKITCRGGIDKSSEISPVILDNVPYSPWLFMRFGNRKPGVPNNPSQLDEWRELEKSFQECGIRDEIHWVSKLMEYSVSPESKRQDELNEITSWLNGLPEPQRLVLINSLFEKMPYVNDTPLYERFMEIANAVDSGRTQETRNWINKLRSE